MLWKDTEFFLVFDDVYVAMEIFSSAMMKGLRLDMN